MQKSNIKNQNDNAKRLEIINFKFLYIILHFDFSILN